MLTDKAKQSAFQINALKTSLSGNLFDSLLFYLTPLLCLLPDYLTPTISSIQHNAGQLPRNCGCFIHHEAKSAEAILFIFTTFTILRQEKFAQN
jgi:hypothetical protein